MDLETFILNFSYAFRPHKPLLVLRLSWAVIKSLIFKKPPLRYVDFSIGFACNLRCQHCFATALEDKTRKTMTIEDYKRVAEECMQLGTVNFSFQGGEPLLYKELPEIIKACKPHKNLISVTTNGILIDEERLKWLKSCGVDILTISLDSGIAHEHDEFRGLSGAFDKTIKGIRLALEHGFKVTIGTVITRQSLYSEGLQALLTFVKGLKLITYLILPVKAGRWNEQSDIFLTEQDMQYLEQLTKSSPYIRTDFQANLGGYGCGAVKEILYITPYGDVLACPFLHEPLGNIFKEPIDTIRKQALANSDIFRQYYHKCLASS
ncbi:MAG: radical SAM protein [Thermodesulfovibrionales bacterium]|nr:radical SAM protein [Thermodesulfovibrionales bacterium]